MKLEAGCVSAIGVDQNYGPWTTQVPGAETIVVGTERMSATVCRIPFFSLSQLWHIFIDDLTSLPHNINHSMLSWPLASALMRKQRRKSKSSLTNDHHHL